ncbi:unnamed protein product [Calicophoron daubneyi]|uniref:protein-tyrosine-phosphatase n=1 Tax=Calicophoron daubneyi TaxID=300641 RepID=A0AAV2TMZ5_CALDB
MLLTRLARKQGGMIRYVFVSHRCWKSFYMTDLLGKVIGKILFLIVLSSWVSGKEFRAVPLGAEDTFAYVRRGANIELWCSHANATNATLLLWKDPTHSVTPAPWNTPTYKIDNVDFSHSGPYSCAIYYLDKVQQNLSVVLIVQDVPDSPRNCTLLPVSPHSLNASWVYGDDHNSSIVLHSLYLHENEKRVKEWNVSAPMRTYTFHGLSPRKCYNLVLRALNDVGWSELSKAVHAFTFSGRPAIKPSISLYNTSQNSALVTAELSSLALLYPSENVTACSGSETQIYGSSNNYMIYVSTLIPYRFVRSYESPVLPGGKQILTISDLEPYTRYNISFAFKNDQFQGPITQLIVTTMEGLPDQPRIIDSAVTNDSITLSWADGPRPAGRLTGYKLELYRCGANQLIEPKESLRLRKPQVGALKRNFTFEGLDPNTCYSIRVASGTSVGFGPFSHLHDMHTDISVPHAPELLSATFLETNDIHLNWTCPNGCHNPFGSIHYKVCWVPQETQLSSGCLSTQTANIGGQAYCHCDPNQKFQTTDLPWSIVQHSGSSQVSFTIRSVVTRPVCPRGSHCEKESSDSNSVLLDLTNAPAYRHLRPAFSRFQWDNTAVGSIIAFTLLIFLSVTLAACFVSRLKCMKIPCGRSSFCHRAIETPAKYRRAVPVSVTKSAYKLISCNELRTHVASCHGDDDAGFQAEFEAIEQTVSADWTTHVARLPDNIGKNRYSNVLAYDHSRVILREVGHKSDYINANYVDGYNRRSAYIAAQGPIPSTFDDFWLMVWEQGSNVIVMISNFIERGRRKCDKYWPSSGQQIYGNISVRMVSEVIRTFYTIRTFVIRHVRSKRGSKDRLVYHYQYTDWRDFDVPPSPLPVLKFVEASITHWSLSDGPIVVHCSAGVGRTGTYICIESLIRQIKAEQAVSVRGFLENIRQYRMKLVQTEQQYAFIHDALREYVLYPCHTIRPSHFGDYLDHLRELDSSGRSNLEKQYELCVESAESDMSRSKTLSSVGRRGSSVYGTADTLGVNSSMVHGFRILSEYIVARHPLPGMEAEFWKMVWDENSSVIVCLSEHDTPAFWPNKASEVRDIGWLHVSFAGSSSCCAPLTRYEFLLTSDREDYALACTLWHFDGWPSVNLENSAEITLAHELLNLASHLSEDDEEFQGSSGPIVVVDNSAGNRVGTFCAMCILINQLTHEDTLDVYFVFKMLCLQRPKMFQSYRDLEFIYSLLHLYLTREPVSSVANSTTNHGTITSMLGLSSPLKRGLHCRHRTKVMVNNPFFIRHKSRPHSGPFCNGRPPGFSMHSTWSSSNGDVRDSLITPILSEHLSESDDKSDADLNSNSQVQRATSLIQSVNSSAEALPCCEPNAHAPLPTSLSRAFSSYSGSNFLTLHSHNRHSTRSLPGPLDT